MTCSLTIIVKSCQKCRAARIPLYGKSLSINIFSFFAMERRGDKRVNNFMTRGRTVMTCQFCHQAHPRAVLANHELMCFRSALAQWEKSGQAGERPRRPGAAPWDTYEPDDTSKLTEVARTQIKNAIPTASPASPSTVGDCASSLQGNKSSSGIPDRAPSISQTDPSSACTAPHHEPATAQPASDDDRPLPKKQPHGGQGLGGRGPRRVGIADGDMPVEVVVAPPRRVPRSSASDETPARASHPPRRDEDCDDACDDTDCDVAAAAAAGRAWAAQRAAAVAAGVSLAPPPVTDSDSCDDLGIVHIDKSADDSQPVRAVRARAAGPTSPSQHPASVLHRVPQSPSQAQSQPGGGGWRPSADVAAVYGPPDVDKPIDASWSQAWPVQSPASTGLSRDVSAELSRPFGVPVLAPHAPHSTMPVASGAPTSAGTHSRGGYGNGLGHPPIASSAAGGARFAPPVAPHPYPPMTPQAGAVYAQPPPGGPAGSQMHLHPRAPTGVHGVWSGGLGPYGWPTAGAAVGGMYHGGYRVW